MKRLLLRGSAVGIVIATFITAGAVGATAIKSKVDDASAARAAKAADSARNAAASANTSRSLAANETVAAMSARSMPQPEPKAAPQAPTPAQPVVPAPGVNTPLAANPRSAAPVTPVLVMGRSELPDSVVAVRSDSDVVVSFDLIMTRTR
ncbi:MAG: hypothetical protein ACREPM_00410, partial [Gemmatimonadaceae bacterium]